MDRCKRTRFLGHADPYVRILGSEKGYTLFEITAVVLILGILFAASTTYIGNESRILDRSATQIAASLRLARSKAILNGRPTGVQFQIDKEETKDERLYFVFDDVGRDGKAPGDANYDPPGGTGKDEGESDNRWNPSGGEEAKAEPASDHKDVLHEEIFFGIIANADSAPPDGDASKTVGTDPIPAPTNALVFDVRGYLVPPMDEDGNFIEDADPPANFIYIVNAKRTEMRAIRVDPQNGYIQIYGWDASAEKWSYR
jgi:prepilin-type N-terminal cleavage/methylation domain-containing protein